jgi:hypothetical protein
LTSFCEYLSVLRLPDINSNDAFHLTDIAFRGVLNIFRALGPDGEGNITIQNMFEKFKKKIDPNYSEFLIISSYVTSNVTHQMLGF